MNDREAREQIAQVIASSKYRWRTSRGIAKDSGLPIQRALEVLELNKTPIGRHRHVTDTDTIELITSLARLQPDERIAATINRLGHRTAHGQTWTAARVCSIRNGHGIAAYREGERQERSELTVDEAADALKVTPTTVLRLIRHKDLVATQVCRNAQWTIRQLDLDEYLVARAGHSPSTHVSGQLALDIQ